MISRRLLALATAERLHAQITWAPGYFGRIGVALPGHEGSTPLDPPAKGNGDDRVQPYYVLFPDAGRPTEEQDLADSYVDLLWPIRITAAGGDAEDVLELVDGIEAALYRWAPDIPDAVVGPFQHPDDGYDAPMLTDRDVTPHRIFIPLRYQLTATAATVPA